MMKWAFRDCFAQIEDDYGCPKYLALKTLRCNQTFRLETGNTAHLDVDWTESYLQDLDIVALLANVALYLNLTKR